MTGEFPSGSFRPLTGRRISALPSSGRCSEVEPIGLQQMDSINYPIEDSLDLHTFDPREVKDLLHDYLDAARHKGLQEVLIIHGKGQGVLRQRVHQVLQAAHAGVASFSNAEPGRGGWGATVVRLVPADAGGAAVEPVGAEKSGESKLACAESRCSTSGEEPPHGLHGLNRMALAVALLLGLLLGWLFYQVLLSFGARPVSLAIPLYGLGGSYGLMRRSESLRQVLLRALVAGVVLGALWVVSVAIQH
jgi:hypothetical protein